MAQQKSTIHAFLAVDDEVGGVGVEVDDSVTVERGGVVGVLFPLLAGGVGQEARRGYER